MQIIAVAAAMSSSGHRMTIVGYDDSIYFDHNGDGVIQESEKGAFKIVNSWGTSYENNGFCWVSYDALNYESKTGDTSAEKRESAMRSFAVQNVDSSDVNYSGAELVMTLNTAARDEVYINVNAKDKAGYNKSQEFTPTFNCNVLRYSLEGSEVAEDGTVTFDLNNVINDISPENVDKYDWSINILDTTDDSKPVVLKDAKIKLNGNDYGFAYTDGKEIDGSNADYMISTEPQGDNIATVYYKNDSWNNANIHFKKDNGSWTNVPGVCMTKSDLDEYTWKYQIDLDSAKGATICFNDGNNNNNYYVTKGIIGIKDGTYHEIGMSADIEFTGKVGDSYAEINVKMVQHHIHLNIHPHRMVRN